MTKQQISALGLKYSKIDNVYYDEFGEYYESADIKYITLAEFFKQSNAESYQSGYNKAKQEIRDALGI